MAGSTNHCERCHAQTANTEDCYGEFICDDCEQNAAERAYEHQCEAFYGGSGPLPLRQQQIEAMKLK